MWVVNALHPTSKAVDHKQAPNMSENKAEFLKGPLGGSIPGPSVSYQSNLIWFSQFNYTGRNYF